ncbi:MAG: hypothetical protein WAU01_13340 [Saprospiraceae bacterium]
MLCGVGKVMPYYYTGLKYRGEIYEIERVIKEKYIRVRSGNSGIAKIRFKVNCEGDIGDLNYEEYDMNYVKTLLNDSIESQLMVIVSQLSDWIPGVDRDGNSLNSHSFLSFRIQDGEIKEILPK